MRQRVEKTILILFLFALFLQGCAATQQRRDVVESGFLTAGEHAMLTEGKKHEALLRYVNPDVDWRSYDKIMLDSVAVWKDPETQDVSPEDLQMLTDFAYGQLHDALSLDYTFVTQPGPGVIRATFAITEAEASNPVADVVTSIIPQTRILTGVKGLIVGGKPGFVGTAGLEAKFTDAQTGKILGLAVDRRGGTKNLSGMTDKWNDVEKAYIYWAAAVRYRLCMLRGDANCVEPEA
ncbi:MAG: DUF3313 domain-containing protein [Nitrospirales bacterium]|nr:DUF3313 domain-containing protein [Nitrospirales bacterium]MDR4483913.1 DUF3313 domain-containing protein [Nitrospirales bacterium]